ncbi:MAG: hypothetical protein C0490_04710 [Marivirga sp.]|nr:hypothetical protein [Marivirga sp.]
MERIKKLFRLMAFLCFLILASTGLGMAAVFGTKERYTDKEIKIEQVDKKEDEGDVELKEAE